MMHKVAIKNMSYRIMGEVQEGIVIDHLPIGKARRLERLLKLEEKGCKYILGNNYGSEKYIKKSFLKIEGFEINKKQEQAIEVFAPSCTINKIKYGKVIEKAKLKDGDILEDIVNCKNQECVTHDKAFSGIQRFSYKEGKLACSYCNEVFLIKNAALLKSALK